MHQMMIGSEHSTCPLHGSRFPINTPSNPDEGSLSKSTQEHLISIPKFFTLAKTFASDECGFAPGVLLHPRRR